jgi:hypothetical protein
MKKILLAGALMLGLAFGANAQKGSIYLYGNTGFQTVSDNGGTSFLLNPGVGYNFNDKWSAGVELGMSTASHNTPSYQAGVFARYTQVINSTFAIYEQLGVGYVHMGDAAGVGPISASNKAIITDADGYEHTVVFPMNGFYANLSLPTVFINVKNGFGVNLGFGNIGFSSVKGDYDGAKSASTFGFKFGNNLSVGISKTFGGKK